MKNREMEEIKAGAVIHLTFDELEAIDLTFCLSITPGQAPSG